jgi:hypothetical protein
MDKLQALEGYCFRLRIRRLRRRPCPAKRHVREPRWDRGLIRLRSPTFIGVRINAAMQVADVNGIRRTIIQTPENRKVGASNYEEGPS